MLAVPLLGLPLAVPPVMFAGAEFVAFLLFLTAVATFANGVNTLIY